jgi:hypothetical protein
MPKKIQLTISDEVWNTVEKTLKEASDGFHVGSINYSDVINEMLLNAKVDIKQLQNRKTDIRRSLKAMASLDDIDLDSAIRTLTELKAKTAKLVRSKASDSESV